MLYVTLPIILPVALVAAEIDSADSAEEEEPIFEYRGRKKKRKKSSQLSSFMGQVFGLDLTPCG